ncbi:MAG: insulinase family protein [Clostridia bacterium]|nr:insulinase family protein [Clostridia bacterium]
MSLCNRELCPSVRCLTLPDARFKTARITVGLFMPLTKDTVEEQAILPFLLTRACAKYPDFTALQRHLNRLYGAAVSGDVARVGETQALVLTAECTADRYALHGETVAADCAALLCEMLFAPALENGVFRAQDVEIEKRCLAQTVAAQVNEKQWYAQCQAEKLLCPDEAYSIGRYGEGSRIEALTPEQVTAAWKRVLREATVQILVQDEGELPAVEEAFRRGFAAVEGRAPVPCETVKLAKRDAVRRTERMDVNQCKLVMGFATGCAGKDAAVPAMRLACALLGGTATSLLMRNVREKLSLCYYCSSQYDRLKGVIFVKSGVEEANAARTEQEILRQVACVANGEFTDAQLEETRRAMCQAFEGVGDAGAAIGAWYVAQGLSDTPETPEETKRKIEAVTREQVIEAAKQWQLGCVYLLAPKGGVTDV